MSFLILIVAIIIILVIANAILSSDDRKRWLAEEAFLASPEYLNALNKLKELQVLSQPKLAQEYIPHSQYIAEEYRYAYECTKKARYYENRGLELEGLLRTYENLEELITKHNEEFVKYELARNANYFATFLKNPLDIQQQEACVTDEDATLVVAGAGTGKTTTIVGKVKYLIEKKGISPNEIILFSFTRKAAEEMHTRLKELLGENTPLVTTFHSFGLEVLKSSCKEYDIVDENEQLNIIKKTIRESKSLLFLPSFYQFATSYLNADTDNVAESSKSLGEYIDATSNVQLETLKSWMGERPNFVGYEKKDETLLKEKVKSTEELRIANFLFVNGIKYEYERPYPNPVPNDSNGKKVYRTYKPDFYLPEYDIYLEHYAIGANGKPPAFFGADGQRRYLEAIEWKKRVHELNNTKLICSYSAWNVGDCLITKLGKLLREHGVTVKGDLTLEDLSILRDQIITSAEKSHIFAIERLISTFISLIKAEGCGNDWNKVLEEKLNKSNNTDYNKSRSRYFLNLAYQCYLDYKQHLSNSGKFDFNDMIIRAAHELKLPPSRQYKYIIVDEFQDMSKGRMLLLNKLREQSKSHLFCVGDDWQSIYRFTGCDLDLFVNFQDYFGYTKILKIEKTYRNSQELIDVMGEFVQQNPLQIKKSLKSSRHIDCPIISIEYGGRTLADAFMDAKNKILELANGKPATVFVIGRTNNDKDYLPKSYAESKTLKIDFLTAHKAKGLEADYIILLNLSDSLLGFPNKIIDDPVLEMILPKSDSYLYAEERRLFYVAVTRARNNAFLLVPEYHPSCFYTELNERGRVLRNTFLDSCELHKTDYKCPRCKTGSLILRQAKDGKLFLGCSHFPRCNFTAPEESLYIPYKCPRCNGPMKYRINSSTKALFLGCVNFPDCTGSLDLGRRNICGDIAVRKKKYWEIHKRPEKKNQVIPNELLYGAKDSVDLKKFNATLKFACPYCQQPYEGERAYIGHSIDCEACHKSFVVTPELLVLPISQQDVISPSSKTLAENESSQKNKSEIHDRTIVNFKTGGPNTSTTKTKTIAPSKTPTIKKTDELLSLCAVGDVETLSHLIKSGQCSINQRIGEINETLLNKSIFYDQSALSRWLIKNGADVNLPAANGRTPLITAAGVGAYSTLWNLLVHGANPNWQIGTGETALMYAQAKKQDSCSIYLLLHGANPTLTDDDGKTVLDYAFKTGLQRHLYDILTTIEECKELYDTFWRLHKQNARPNYLGIPSNASINGWPIVVALAKYGLVNELALMLAVGGADPNSVNHAGASALNFACKYQHIDCVRTLITYGANVNAQSAGGRTPLMMAVKYDATGDIVDCLMQNRADPKVRSTYDGWTALDFVNQINDLSLRDHFTALLNF